MSVNVSESSESNEPIESNESSDPMNPVGPITPSESVHVTRKSGQRRHGRQVCIHWVLYNGEEGTKGTGGVDPSHGE